MDIHEKQVRWDRFCYRCEHEKLDENEEPCCDCLEVFVREGTDEPEYFEEKKNVE